MKYKHLGWSPNGFMKKLAWVGLIGCSVLFGAREAKADPVEWGSISAIVPNVAGSASYTSPNAPILPNRLTAICYVSDGGVLNAIGGFDLVKGVITLSYYNQDWNPVTGYGISNGDTANSAPGSNSGNNANTLPIYYEVFYDNDGDGGFEAPYNGYIANRTEQLSPAQFIISGFSPFQIQGNGTLTFSTSILDPSFSSLAALGIVSLGGGTNQLTLSVIVSNAATFSVTYKNSLTNVSWQNLGTYSKTGAVTIITDTNNVPQRFYRVVTP